MKNSPLQENSHQENVFFLVCVCFVPGIRKFKKAISGMLQREEAEDSLVSVSNTPISEHVVVIMRVR